MGLASANTAIAGVLVAAQWPVSSNVIFGSVIETAAPVERIAGFNLTLPAAAVRPVRFTADRSESDIWRVEFEVVIFAQHADATTDRDGEIAFKGTTAETGILNIADQVLRVLGCLDETDGIPTILRTMGMTEPPRVQGALVHTSSLDRFRVDAKQSIEPFTWVKLKFDAMIPRA